MTVNKKINTRDKVAIKFMWESGDYSIAEIAKELNFSPTAIRNLVTKEGWKKGAREEEIRARLEDELEAQENEALQEKLKRISETRDETYRFAKAIANQAMREFTTSMTDKTPLAMCSPNMKTLKLMSEVLKNTKEMRWSALEMDKNDETLEDIEDLTVSSMDEDEVAEVRNKQEINNKALEIDHGLGED